MAVKQEKEIISRWGNVILDDNGYVDIPGWILRNYHKCGVSPLEMMFIAHIMSFKYDRTTNQPQNSARPSLATVAEYMGRDIRNVRRLKTGLISKHLLSVTSVAGKPDEYDFSGLTNRCLQFATESQIENGQNHPSDKNVTPDKNALPTPDKNIRPIPRIKTPAEDSESIQDSENKKNIGANAPPSQNDAGADAVNITPASVTNPTQEKPQEENSTAKVDPQGEGLESPPSSAPPPDPTYSTEVKNAFAILCAMDWKIKRHATAMGQALTQIRAREPVTLNKLRTFFCNWRKGFKGKDGTPPKPHQVVEEWVAMTGLPCTDTLLGGSNGNERHDAGVLAIGNGKRPQPKPEDYGF